MGSAASIGFQSCALALGHRRGARADEVKVLSSLKHPYIVAYKDSFIEDGFLNIVMESQLAQGAILTHSCRVGHTQIAGGADFRCCLSDAQPVFAACSAAYPNMNLSAR